MMILNFHQQVYPVSVKIKLLEIPWTSRSVLGKRKLLLIINLVFLIQTTADISEVKQKSYMNDERESARASSHPNRISTKKRSVKIVQILDYLIYVLLS